MANKPKRKFRKYLRGAIQSNLDLGTLAGKALTSVDNVDAVSEKAWITSVKATWSLSFWTPGAGDGPIVVGIAHSDYTDAEIFEWINNDAGWEEADEIGQEVAKRKIRIVGEFLAPADSASISRLNNGNKVRTKCGWQLTMGQTVSFWAFNTGFSALATTAPLVNVTGQANLWPN